MSRVYAIVLNTFREAVRDRVLYGALGFAGAVLLFTLALAQLSLNEDRRVIVDLGTATISLFSIMVAIFLGSSLLFKEIERKTVYVILPKPIRRHEFLLGKYFGITLTASVFVALTGAFLLWLIAIHASDDVFAIAAVPLLLSVLFAVGFWKGRDRTFLLVPWAASALIACASLCAHVGVSVQPLLAQLALTVGEVVVLTGIALLFSSFSTPFLTGMLTFGVWLVGRAADDMITLKTKLLSPMLRSLLYGVAEVAPNFNLFVPSRYSLELQARAAAGPWPYVGTTWAYALVYSAIVLFAAAMIFRRRDFL